MAGEDVGVHAGGRASAGVAGGVTVKGLGPQPARSRNSAARLENHGVREIPDADKGHPRRDRPPFPSHSRAFRRDKLRHGPRFHSRPHYGANGRFGGVLEGQFLAGDLALAATLWFQPRPDYGLSNTGVGLGRPPASAARAESSGLLPGYSRNSTVTISCPRTGTVTRPRRSASRLPIFASARLTRSAVPKRRRGRRVTRRSPPVRL